MRGAFCARTQEPSQQLASSQAHNLQLPGHAVRASLYARMVKSNMTWGGAVRRRGDTGYFYPLPAGSGFEQLALQEFASIRLTDKTRGDKQGVNYL